MPRAPGNGAPQTLYVQNWPYRGLSDTSTASEWVTDSAAGMTAIVSGHKTHNDRGKLGEFFCRSLNLALAMAWTS